MFIILGSGCRESIIIKNLREHNNTLKIICISTYYNNQIFDLVDNYYKIDDQTSIKIFEKILQITNNYQNNKIYVVPGSETFLKDNLVDLLIKSNINVIGPIKNLALIETSKIFCREFLKIYNLDKYQPKYIIFNKYIKKKHEDFIKKLNYNFVVKPDGLYGGKGVKIYNKNNYLESFIYCENLGDKYLIEEKLYGEEFVLMSFCDGYSIKHMPISKDYKDLDYDNEIKTGGMGSIILENHSLPFLNNNDIEICHQLNKEVMLNLSKDNYGYKGILYGSFMKTDKGIKIIEYNSRFGDSESLNVITLLKTKLEDIFVSLCDSNLDKLDIEYYNENCICTYLVPNGYPLQKTKGLEINLNLPKKTIYENIVIGGLYVNKIESNEKMKTNGSRICCVIDRNKNLDILYNKLQNLILNIKGEFHYRKDIGTKESIYNEFIHNKEDNNNLNVYEKCGVNIEEGDKVVEKIKNDVKETFNDNIIGEFGDYCGFYNINKHIQNMKEPLIVSSIDGVGTKTKFILKYTNIEKGLKILAHDIVNHCVDDIIVKGAIPLYITDYIASNKIISENISYFVEGLKEACLKNNIVLLGGETAELYKTYSMWNNYEIVGNITGIIDKQNMINGKKDVKEGDYIYGLKSNGIHTNGYSIINKLFDELDENELEKRRYILEQLLKPHKSYLNELNILKEYVKINGLCHITGGGYYNIERLLDDNLGVNLKVRIMDPFKFIQLKMNISDKEMYKTFNCGYGMLVFINKKDTYKIKKLDLDIEYLGRVVKRNINRINVLDKISIDQ